MKATTERKDKSFRRKARVSFKISNNFNRHKLYVHRSNKHIYAQLMDFAGNTIAGVSSSSIEVPQGAKGKIDISFQTGLALAQKAKDKKITEVVFNRGPYKYHGRVKALAEGARKGGLKF